MPGTWSHTAVVRTHVLLLGIVWSRYRNACRWCWLAASCSRVRHGIDKRQAKHYSECHSRSNYKPALHSYSCCFAAFHVTPLSVRHSTSTIVSLPIKWLPSKKLTLLPTENMSSRLSGKINLSETRCSVSKSKTTSSRCIHGQPIHSIRCQSPDLGQRHLSEYPL